jgi:phosphatidylserine/phosphatidylglycerophosphate/cardiolipin synthase-like enzyme
MGLVTWIKSLLPLSKKNDYDKSLRELRKEIEKLRKENKELKEFKQKVILFPQRSAEQIPIRFFDENIETEIIKNIREAEEEICIAVAWFTSWKLMQELSTLKSRGINIKVIISDEKANIRERNISKLQNACNILKVAVIPGSRDESKNNLMHNKYCIIDNKKVIDGSYNWSYNAQNNLEHVIVIESKTVAKMYKDSFDRIYSDQQYYYNSTVYSNLL